GQDGADFRSKGQLPIRDAVIDELDTHGIPRHDQPPFLHIPNSDAKHAIKMIKDFGPPFFVPMNNHLSIAPCPEMMAALFKFSTQLLEIVNLAVEDDPDGFLRVGHRLMTTG